MTTRIYSAPAVEGLIHLETKQREGAQCTYASSFINNQLLEDLNSFVKCRPINLSSSTEMYTNNYYLIVSVEGQIVFVLLLPIQLSIQADDATLGVDGKDAFRLVDGIQYTSVNSWNMI